MQGAGVVVVQMGREAGTAVSTVASDGLEWAMRIVRAENPDGDPVDTFDDGQGPVNAPVAADVEAAQEMAHVGAQLQVPPNAAGLTNVAALPDEMMSPEDMELLIQMYQQDRVGWDAARNGFLNPAPELLDDDATEQAARRMRTSLHIGSYLDQLAPPTLRKSATTHYKQKAETVSPHIIETAFSGKVVVTADWQHHPHGFDPVPITLLSTL